MDQKGAARLEVLLCQATPIAGGEGVGQVGDSGYAAMPESVTELVGSQELSDIRVLQVSICKYSLTLFACYSSSDQKWMTGRNREWPNSRSGTAGKQAIFAQVDLHCRAEGHSECEPAYRVGSVL